MEIDLPPNWFENLENDLPLMFQNEESIDKSHIPETTNTENNDDNDDMPDLLSDSESDDENIVRRRR